MPTSVLSCRGCRVASVVSRDIPHGSGSEEPGRGRAVLTGLSDGSRWSCGSSDASSRRQEALFAGPTSRVGLVRKAYTSPLDKGTDVRYHELMWPGDLVDVVRSVAATDAATCDVTGLTTLVADVHRLRCWLDSVDAKVVARRRELASVGGRRSSREADVVVDRAVVCEAMPEVHSALASGALSAGHADAIARAANRLDDHEREELAALAPTLVAEASSTSVETFSRKVRDLARRISRDDGLRHHEKLQFPASCPAVAGRRGHVPHPDQPRP